MLAEQVLSFSRVNVPYLRAASPLGQGPIDVAIDKLIGNRGRALCNGGFLILVLKLARALEFSGQRSAAF